ncbi:unnamed protein product, partial [Vitis vinifera]|uniref:Uncharacterized protein n=1 Tax=Vitis vinifera TaxID=29760 RepID=E0CSJ1_VITVI
MLFLCLASLITWAPNHYPSPSPQDIEWIPILADNSETDSLIAIRSNDSGTNLKQPKEIKNKK